MARFQFLALFAKDESAQFVSELLRFCRIGGIAEALCKIEKLLFFVLPGCQAQFHKLEQHSIAAEVAALCDGFNLPVNPLRQSYAASNLL